MENSSRLPPDLQSVADGALREFAAGNKDPVGLGLICKWLELDGWDLLIADFGEQMALKLGAIAHLDFTDSEARLNLDIPDDAEIQDADRIRWARQRIDYAQSGDDGYLLGSLHACRLDGTDGSHGFLGCHMEVHGQAGEVCQWWGLWESPEAFYDAVGEGLAIWVLPRMGEITDTVILSMWHKEQT